VPQLFELSILILIIPLALSIVFLRHRKTVPPEQLIASMHRHKLPMLLKTHETLLAPEISISDLLKIRHNAVCLVNLCRSFPPEEQENVAYVSHRSLAILFCIPAAMAQRGLRIAVKRYPLFATKWAASLYVEMWMRAKSMAYEYREDLIPALEMLA